MHPPNSIDGARVLEWAWSEERFGYVGDAPVHGLALCRYENSGEIYRFSCGGSWVVLQDQVHPSTLSAKHELPTQYQLATAIWQLAEENAIEIRGMTVNERLDHFQLFADFDAAVEARIPRQIIAVLRAAYLSEEQAIATTSALLLGQPQQGFHVEGDA